ncbi:MAG TPA: response regulator transcription factor, partial [Leptospiraceae bacterium]|nr:response regulator transcription factor [Leptospiraceae bacterium]
VILQADPRFKVVGLFPDGKSLLDFLKLNSCDLLILDIGIPGGEDFHILKQVKSNTPEMKVVIFSMYEGAQFFLEAKKHGADSYVLKKDSYSLMPSIVEMTLNGVSYCSEELKRYKDSSDVKVTLNTIEEKIVKGLEQNLSYKEIAESIQKSEKTVQSYIYKMRKRFQVQNNTELLMFLYKNYSHP